MRQDHVCLRLFFLLLYNAGQLFVLFNHFLDNCVNLLFLPDVFRKCLCAHFFLLLDLILDEVFVAHKIRRFLCNVGPVLSIVVLLNLEVGGINCCVLLQILLSTVLSLGGLGSTLFVEICMTDVSLKLLQFITFSAHFLDLTLATLVNYLQF